MTPLDIHLVEDFLSDIDSNIGGIATFSNAQHPIAVMLSSIWTDYAKAVYKEKQNSFREMVDENKSELGE